MNATTAILIQATVAILITGVIAVFIAHVTGLTRPVLAVIRHPLRTVETVIAVLMSWLPAPRKRTYRRFYRGGHRA